MTFQGRPLPTALVALAVTAAALSPVFAVDCSVQDTRLAFQSGSAFNITMSGFSSFDVQTSIDYWSGCPGYGPYIPPFEFGGSDGLPVSIVRVSGNSTSLGGGCGETALNRDSYGQITSATVSVWTNQSNGASCAPLTDSLAHEFGHLLGLADATDPSCIGHIMGARNAGGTRTVGSDDCAVADNMWTTSSEVVYTAPYCDAYCQTYCVDNLCQDHPSPILIDLENDGIHLTGLGDPVWFDIDADGMPDLMSWTDRGDGFLALDRNGNGTIDDGGELFGTATRLANGARALNGYEALAELDTWVFNGNGDGHLDSADPAFGSLLLWTDRNHDGISQPEELETLAQAGIQRIDLDYRRSRRTDRYGNEFRFLGRAWKTVHDGVVRPVPTWDVFFLVVP